MYKTIACFLLLSLVGCSASAPQISSSATPIAPPSMMQTASTITPPGSRVTKQPTASNALTAPALTEQLASPGASTPVTPTASPSAAATSPSIQRDYEESTPLPTTGRLTIRQDIRNLESDRLIACPQDTGPYVYAESTHYRIQICSQEFDPWLPKYYIGTAKDGSGELRITSTNLDEARQLIFRHGGYTYIIHRDGARPEQVNAYLEVYPPNGNGYAEALLYLYENLKPAVR